MEIIQRTEHFEFSFKFNPRLVQIAKKAPGARWNPAKKLWWVPLERGAELRSYAIRNSIAIVQPNKGPVNNEPETFGEVPPLPELLIDIPLKLKMREYQRSGVAYGLQHKKIIIGDEPGLGKTAQAIAIVAAEKSFPCVIVCPSALKENWRREWEMWTEFRPYVMNDSVKDTWLNYYNAGLADVFICNFESLKKYFVAKIDMHGKTKWTLKDVYFKESVKQISSVIIDEAHRVKNTATQQTKLVKGICKDKEIILLLTGTPVVNNPKDLIAQLGIIERMHSFGGYTGFINRYCAGINEASNLKELNYKLHSTCFYRREAKEVLKDLPDKMRQVVYCDITTRTEYNAAVKDLENYLREWKKKSEKEINVSMRGEVMVRIGTLKNISAKGKLPDVSEFIKDTLEQGEKLVVFAHLKEIIAALKNEFPDAVTVTGEDDNNSRQNSIDRFQTDPNCKLILCSIQAAGVGLTLTASSRVAFVEQGWHPAIMEQCEARVHRMGQKNFVQCFYFLGKETIDVDIYKMINEKRQMVNTITGAEDTVHVSIQDNIINLFSEKL